MSDIIKLNEAVPETTRTAIELHTQIMQHGKTAAVAMVEFSRGLKRMRDERLYEELGCTSFEVYVDDVVGIGQRQAYTYIRALEQLGPSLMEEQAHLGITKLEILTQVYAVDREAFLEEHNVEDMSARELRELTAKLKDTGEQLSFVTEENERLKEELATRSEEVVADVAGTIEQKNAYIEELERQVREFQKSADDEKDRIAARIREAHEAGQAAERKRVEADKRAAVAAAEKATAEKYNKAVKDAKAAQKRAEEALEEAKRQANERVAQLTAAVDAEKAETAARAAELEKQLKIAGDPDTTAVAVYVEEVGGLLNKALQKIGTVKSRDVEAGAKLAGAMCRVMDAVRPRFEELYQNG
ncbi:MAG: DUF3102 domain-containing protein [Ruminococcaceae bacterium]|nr:DUF3102 domain-containing protein [Oscillospiraceae bacterium]